MLLAMLVTDTTDTEAGELALRLVAFNLLKSSRGLKSASNILRLGPQYSDSVGSPSQKPSTGSWSPTRPAWYIW